LVETFQNSLYKVGIGYNNFENRRAWGSVLPHNNNRFSVDFMVGQRSIEQHIGEHTLSEDFTTISSEINYVFPINWLHSPFFQISNYFVNDDMKTTFLLLPEYRNYTDLSLTWFLPSDNRVGLGTRINLLSKVHNAQWQSTSTDPTVDIYFSVGITKVFDLKVEFNNIYRSMNFGNDRLQDFHVTSYLVWYFIN